MDIGIKLYSEDLPMVEQFVDAADFMEIMIEPDFPYSGLKEYDIPYTIHAPHHKFKVNLADPELLESNLRRVNQATEAADFLDADWVIVHPGEIANQNCSLGAVNTFLEEISDDRVIVENMPYRSTEKHVGHTPGELKELLKHSPGICLDFAHAAVVEAGEDYHRIVEELAKLEPKLFHISDSHSDSGRDQHIALGDGDLELDYFKKIIKASESKKVTIETPPDRRRHLEEIGFLRK